MESALTNELFILAIIVIACFAIVFIVMFILNYSSKKKVVMNHLDDEKINETLESNINKFNKKIHRLTFFENYIKNRKRNKIANIIVNVILGLFFISVISFSIFSYFNSTSLNPTFINNSAFIVIQSDSMSEKNEANTYLDESSYKYIDTRFDKYELISLTKYNNQEINLYDIVAFNMDDTLTVHRCINIVKDEKGIIYYTFRGDSNSSSFTNETNLTSDKIIGIYSGFKSIALGRAATYLKSGIGLIAIGAAGISLITYFICYDKSNTLTLKRYEELIIEKFNLDKEIFKEKIKKKKEKIKEKIVEVKDDED